MGRYTKRSVPMWTPFVWLSEGVTNLYVRAVPNSCVTCAARRCCPWRFNLLAATSAKVYLDTTDITEFDSRAHRRPQRA
jgi:hypothetical protein